MKVKCLIIDDEPLAINVIKKHLESFDNFEVLFTCNNAVEAFNLLAQNTIDLVFMDINMPKINGIEFIRNLKDPPMIIVTTAYREYAVESFELDVVDYLVKPISFKRLMKAVHKVTRIINDKLESEGGKSTLTSEESTKRRESYIFVKVNKKMVKIYFDDILYVESLKDYVSIKTIYEDYITHFNLSAITKLLPKHLFIRIHRSYTIALNKVKVVDGNCIQISDKMLPIGRNFVKDAKSIILNGFEN
ncbi:LytR/AlgR family response regulator transcription factor [Aquimarina hainanensis]|uniref:LytR/AlgR family response regulator transcription factor n=1 Tax=Aquimarina hainanensis TaxID=1578017 RepID=A0ABW5NDN3_9FLAO|nr:LytTR family DNA-binding domain-containing protein [Aquimarina sp. TRL1]QKX06542.1 response regulator transcription factor [Aquimarina sp. TRL1]